MCQQRNQLRKLIEAHVNTVDYEQMEPYTLLSLYAKIDGRIYRGVGLATCGPTDEWIEGTQPVNGREPLGYRTAYGRAIHDIVEQLIVEEINQVYEDQHIASALAFLRSRGFTTIQ